MDDKVNLSDFLVESKTFKRVIAFNGLIPERKADGTIVTEIVAYKGDISCITVPTDKGPIITEVKALSHGLRLHISYNNGTILMAVPYKIY